MKPTSAILKSSLGGTSKPKILTDLTEALRANTEAVRELHTQLLEMAQAAQQPKAVEWPPMSEGAQKWIN